MIIILAATCMTGAAIGAGACYAIMAAWVAGLKGSLRWVKEEADCYKRYTSHLEPLAKIGLARKCAIARQSAKRKAMRAGRVK